MPSMHLAFLGPWEIALIVALVFILFGAKKLPQLGSGLGSGIRNFKDAISGKEEPQNLESGESQPKKEEEAG
ncbi:Sec-independent protein translocase protein TatA [Sulfidibacter corallicola]